MTFMMKDKLTSLGFSVLISKMGLIKQAMSGLKKNCLKQSFGHDLENSSFHSVVAVPLTLIIK